MARGIRRVLDEGAHKRGAPPAGAEADRQAATDHATDGQAAAQAELAPAQGAPAAAGAESAGEVDARGEPRGRRSDTPTLSGKRNLNEAAHKLGYWPEKPIPKAPRQPSQALLAATDQERDVVAHAGRLVLALAALGVVFGDLGTSPLYTMQVIFTAHSKAAHPNTEGVYGVVSLVFWSMVIVVCIKYAGIIMRAHNRGDGGIMALSALIQRRRITRAGALVVLGLVGAGLFFGDGMITPAISVTSAVEGLNVATPALKHLVLPIALGILVALFMLQRFGTGGVGRLFGPVLIVWFIVIAGLGARQVAMQPAVLNGLLPIYAFQFLVDHGVAAFLALGGVVLALTGAEALYADRGHFGAGPIRLAWFGIVFPGVLLSYLGQGALILSHPSAIHHGSPFYLVVPAGAQLAMVFLATVATIIASQAAITGSFSVAKQAVQLGFLPRIKIVHTSQMEGQIYVPTINWILCAGVVTLVLVFQHSTRLADIYGVAVTGTFILDTTLFLAVARALWRTSWWKLAPLGTVFYIVEVSFFSSNITKVAHGAWLPLLVGLTVASLMVTWRRGRDIVTRNRTQEEGSLEEFLDRLCRPSRHPVIRVPGLAVFLSPDRHTTPLALRAQVEHNHVLHERVVIVSLEWLGIPNVDIDDRFHVERLGKGLFKLLHITIRVGYRDRSNIPEALALARKRGLLPRDLDLEGASYFLSRITIVPSSDSKGMSRWRKELFLAMARNSASPIDQFGLPSQRTVMTGSQIPV